MKNRSSVFLPFLAVFVLVIGLGCLCSGLGGGTPTQAPPIQSPVQQPTKPPVPTQVPATDVPAPTQVTTSDGGLKTFVDQNKFYQIEVPSDWTYQQTVDKQNNYYYIDTFTSPDSGAVIENIAYDDGTPFTGSTNGKFALYLLNTFYSKTGKEGDIKISDDTIQKDGSERLIWSSKEGKYSGISYFEVRNKTTFLLFTVDWGDSVKDQYLDTLNQVIASYAIP
jgi:hypothetical protein